MPRYEVAIQATLENCIAVELHPPFHLHVRQTGGTEEKDVLVDPENEEEAFGSKGTCHYKMKWDKKDKHEATLLVLERKALTANDKLQTVLVLEARGMEVVGFKPQGVTVRSKSKKTVFEDGDLSDPDGFSDFDEVLNEPVSVTDVVVKVRLVTS